MKLFGDRVREVAEIVWSFLRRVAIVKLSGGHWSIFWPLAPKRWVTEEKVFGVACQVSCESPFHDIATAQLLTQGL